MKYRVIFFVPTGLAIHRHDSTTVKSILTTVADLCRLRYDEHRNNSHIFRFFHRHKVNLKNFIKIFTCCTTATGWVPARCRLVVGIFFLFYFFQIKKRGIDALCNVIDSYKWRSIFERDIYIAKSTLTL